MASFNYLVLIFSIAFIAALLSVPLVSGEGQCISGKFHKPSPGAETGQLQTCKAYESNACCKPSFTAELAATRAKVLYNHTWDLCKNLSSACERFWIEQECFYQCDPYVYKWKHTTHGNAIHQAPICSTYCDSWFDACRNDHICVEDVLNGYELDQFGYNSCPANSTCKSYADMFNNGTGLCNKMWSSSYVYTEPNADQSNCMVMNFTGANPNKRVSVNPTGSSVINIASALIVMGLSVLAVIISKY